MLRWRRWVKEGWDVTNLYTIVPLRAANARTLIEQSIGRGLRLPYGRKTGVDAVDRLSIVAHDRFQEIVDAANSSDSMIRLQQVILADDEINQKTKSVVSQPIVEQMLGIQPDNITSATEVAGQQSEPMFAKPEEQQVAQITYEVIRKLGNQPDKLPSAGYLKNAEVQAEIRKAVEELYRPPQMELEGVVEKPDVASIVARTTEVVVQQTIDIPRILVVPQGEVRSGYKPFPLNLGGMHFQPPSDDLWLQYLRTGGTEVIGFGSGGIKEKRFEDYIVSALMDCNDVSYDEHADLLYDLAGQTVAHFQSYLSDGEDVHKVLRMHRREIAGLIHAQMQKHYWEETAGYDVVISKGFTDLKECAYTVPVSEPATDYKVSPTDKSNMAKYLFGGCQRASVHTATYGGKPWKYALIPHNQLATNMTVEGLVQRFGCD